MAQPGRDEDDQDGDESRNDGPDQPGVTSCPSVVLGPTICPAAATRSPTAHDANPTLDLGAPLNQERTTGFEPATHTFAR
jgi:hypothetical protein